MYLARYHEVTISTSGVWRILKRLDMNRLPSSQRHKPHAKRWQRYEKPQPGHRVQIDVKFIAPLSPSTKRYYQYTAIDDCTRLRILKVYERNNQRSAIQFVDYLIERLPFRVEVIQTDNGGEFQKDFHWHVLDKGVQHVYIRPRTPRLNGKVCDYVEHAAPARPDPGQGMTKVSFVRSVGRHRCCALVRTGQTDLT
jgi:transposase InsO family protein